MYYNLAFIESFPFQSKEQKIRPINDLLKQFAEFAINEEEIKLLEFHLFLQSTAVTSCELCICAPEEKYYNVSIQPVTAYGNEQIGKLISFNDITDYKNMAKIEAELASTKARFEMSRDAHDIIGHAMTHIIMYLRKDLSGLSEEELNLRSNAVNALKVAEEKTSDFRELLYKDFGNDAFKTNLQNIDTDYTKKFMSFLEKYYKALYMMCLEGINNSLKHGQANNIDIIIKYNIKCLDLHIIDDGKGCKLLIKGIGLSGMLDRVKNLGGVLNFSTEEGEGFRILAQIPLT